MWNGSGLLSSVDEIVKVAEGHRRMSSSSTAVGDMLVRTSEFREQTEKVVDSAGELKTNVNSQIAVKVG